MLNPDHRSLVTSLLTPPPGMVLDAALTTTFTLDPVTLLTMPMHLAWLASGQDRTLLADGIRLLEALRRVGNRLTAYSDRGRIHAPTVAHPLYALLESMIVEVRAPGGGAFHPKIWVLRFTQPEGATTECLRLGVLSRNLTADRSWDLSLQLEGRPGARYIAANRGIGEFVRDLPKLAVADVPEMRREAAGRLGDEIRRTAWELPAGWNEVAFHVLDKPGRAWAPPASSEMAVISPFLTPGALDALHKTTGASVALISRPDALAALTPQQRARFGKCMVLDGAAESEDGEDSSERHTLGLHAKAVVLRNGWYTHLFVGSVNATAPAMLNGSNVEVWAELIGKRSQVGGIDELLSSNGLGALLADFDPATPADILDPMQVEAERSLDAAHSALAAASLSLQCTPMGGDWRLTLRSSARVVLGGVVATAWPLSIRDGMAVPAEGLDRGDEVILADVTTADVTGLIGFVLRVGTFETRFALNVSVLGMPVDRDGAILRRVVQNRDGFLRYLLLLLGDFFGDPVTSTEGETGGEAVTWNGSSGASQTLLEEMVRVFARDRRRLDEVKRVVDRLRAGGAGDDVVPPEFIALWDVFLRAIAGSS